MDLIKEDERDAVFMEKRALLKSLTLPLKMVAFKTSIWDETLYKVCVTMRSRERVLTNSCI